MSRLVLLNSPYAYHVLILDIGSLNKFQKYICSVMIIRHILNSQMNLQHQYNLNVHFDIFLYVTRYHTAKEKELLDASSWRHLIIILF